MSPACMAGGAQMSAKSRASRDRSSSAVSYRRRFGSRSASASRAAGRGSAAATIATSSRASHPGRWPCIATLPAPRIAPRSTEFFQSAATALSFSLTPREDGGQGLVEDVQPFHRCWLVDVQGWIDPDHRRIGHRDEASAQAFLEERLRPILRDELLRAAVFHELEAEEQALAAHVADDGVLLLHREELSEHRPAHLLGVLDEVLPGDDLERRQPGRGGERVASIRRRASARVRERRAGT